MAASPEKKESPPNFVFIAIDDLNVYNTVLGGIPQSFLAKVYPDPEIREAVVKRLTPNLDRLASQSLTFENAFCASPLCGPSRTALMTGVPPHLSGYYHHDRHFRAYETLTKVTTLPQYLKDNGYFTSGLGKVFHKGRSYLDRGYFSDWPDRLYSWSHWIEVHSGTGRTQGSKAEFTEKNSKYWKQDGRPIKHFTRFGKTTLPLNQSNDYTNAKFVADLISEGSASIVDEHGKRHNLNLPTDKPYFLACGLFAPHLPWIAREEFFEMFPQEEMRINKELLKWVRKDLEDLSSTGQNKTARTGFTKLINYGLELDGEGGDVNAWKDALQSYLATIAAMDQCLGSLVDAIENNPAGHNTVVLLWSDHGYHIGDKNREGKTTLWEGANHCNLIIRAPQFKEASRGLRTTAPVSLQDMYPTIVSLAGLDRPTHLHGYDLTPILKNPDTNWKAPVLNTFEADNHSLRTLTHRYLRFENGDQELYDLSNDPLEVINLANDPESKDQLEKFSELLDKTLAMKPSDY